MKKLNHQSIKNAVGKQQKIHPMCVVIKEIKSERPLDFASGFVAYVEANAKVFKITGSYIGKGSYQAQFDHMAGCK